MSRFNPDSIQFDPPDEPDHLGSAILENLGRDLLPNVSWGPIRTLIAGAISLGLLPLVFPPRRICSVSADDRALLEYATQWLKRADEPCLSAEPRILRMSATLGAVSIFAVLLTIALHRGLTFAELSAMTYGFGRRGADQATPMVRAVHAAWAWLLTLAYLCSFLAIWRAARLLGDKIAQLNAEFPNQGLEPAKRPPVLSASSLIWLLLSAPLAWFGAAWAIPMMLAGAAQRRYIRLMCKPMRASLVRAMHRNIAADPSRGHMNVPESLRVAFSDKAFATAN